MLKRLRPQNYTEVFYVGDYFRGDTPVIMDLNDLPEHEAVSVIDFAAGLVVGRDGSMEKVAPGVFLLLPRQLATTAPRRGAFSR